jgi:hypothetical protein
VNVLGIDPGAKPGYYYDSGAVPWWRKAASWLGLGTISDPEAIVTEGVWFGGEAPPASIAKLSFTCGMQLMRAMLTYPGAAAYRLPVKVWKDAITYRGGTLPGGVFLGRLVRELEIPATEKWTEDELCARGLVAAFVRLGGPEGKLEKYRIKEPK